MILESHGMQGKQTDIIPVGLGQVSAADSAPAELIGRPTHRPPNSSPAELIGRPTHRPPNSSPAQLIAHPTHRPPNSSPV